MSFFSLSMRSGSATPFMAFRSLFSTFSGLARPRPPFRKLSYSATLLKHLILGKGRGTFGEYNARNGSNLSEHTSSLELSSASSLSRVVSDSCFDRANVPELTSAVSLLSVSEQLGLSFLSLSSMFQTIARRARRGGQHSRELWETFHPIVVSTSTTKRRKSSTGTYFVIIVRLMRAVIFSTALNRCVAFGNYNRQLTIFADTSFLIRYSLKITTRFFFRSRMCSGTEVPSMWATTAQFVDGLYTNQRA